MQPATPDPPPTTPPPRRRGAPKGNLNAMKDGRYSNRLKGLRAALEAMPMTTEALAKCEGDPRKLEGLAYALQYQAEILLAMARGSLKDLDNRELRNRAIRTIALARQPREAAG